MDRLQSEHETRIWTDVSRWLNSQYGEKWKLDLTVAPVARTRICIEIHGIWIAVSLLETELDDEATSAVLTKVSAIAGLQPERGDCLTLATFPGPAWPAV